MLMSAPRKSENKQQVTGYNPASTVKRHKHYGKLRERSGTGNRKQIEVGRAMLEIQGQQFYFGEVFGY